LSRIRQLFRSLYGFVEAVELNSETDSFPNILTKIQNTKTLMNLLPKSHPMIESTKYFYQVDESVSLIYQYLLYIQTFDTVFQRIFSAMWKLSSPHDTFTPKAFLEFMTATGSEIFKSISTLENNKEMLQKKLKNQLKLKSTNMKQPLFQ
jgi:hypothetical protein